MIRLAFYNRESKEKRSEACGSDLRSHPGFWWNRIQLRLYEGKESEYSPRTCSTGRPAGGSLCPRPITLHRGATPGVTRLFVRQSVAPENISCTWTWVSGLYSFCSPFFFPFLWFELKDLAIHTLARIHTVEIKVACPNTCFVQANLGDRSNVPCKTRTAHPR